jgi:transposase-like protein
MIYPMDLMEFETKFGTEKSCRDYLFQLKFKNGFICEKCSCIDYWITKEYVCLCKTCRNQVHLTANTVFQDTHKPLAMWFRAIWWVTCQKNGTSALGLQRCLGLGSYRTAWAWLHKLRIAMVRPGRDKLSGRIEFDEAFIGGKQSGGKRGRGTDNKSLVVIAVECTDNKIGRIRLGIIPDASSQSLEDAIEKFAEKGSAIVTDGWQSYNNIGKLGYKHEEDRHLPKAHLVISLLKRWILGTLQGSVSEQHLEYYLDEFTFRFNRRTSESRGKLFYRLVEQAAEIKPIIYSQIIDRKGA